MFFVDVVDEVIFNPNRKYILFGCHTSIPILIDILSPNRELDACRACNNGGSRENCSYPGRRRGVHELQHFAWYGCACGRFYCALDSFTKHRNNRLNPCPLRHRYQGELKHGTNVIFFVVERCGVEAYQNFTMERFGSERQNDRNPLLQIRKPYYDWYAHHPNHR